MGQESMKRVSLAEATVDDMREFGAIAGLPVKAKMTQSELVDLLQTAGYHYIFVSLAVEKESLGFERVIDENTEYDPENERWCKVKFALGAGTNQNSLIPVAVNDDDAYLPRGRVIAIRERLFHHIKECKEIRFFQDEHSGNPIGHFSDVAPREVERYPLSFYGFCGLVRDGLPKFKKGVDVLVIPPESHLGQAEAAQMARAEA